jgi:non-ribosomal peptide synthetase component F
MNDLTRQLANPPPEKEAIRAKCFHPSGAFSEFKKEDIERSIPHRFEQMVAKYAGRVAVKDRTRQLTYAELNQSANCVAQAILAQRGEVQEPVALLLPKGTPLVVAILGTLKAGKIFVLLDPTLPHARIRYILDDVQAGLLVTSGEYLLMAKAVAGRIHASI